MLKVTGIKKYFDSGGTAVKAVDGISFSLPDGVLAAIVGKSGSGKSTLLALLGALDKPNHGSIRIGEVEITKLSDRKLTNYRAKEVGFVFQSFNLIPNLSALDNVALPMEFAGLPGDKRARAQKLLTEVGLSEDKQRRRPGRLSGGEQQRVAIARALANSPKLILADEPTGNLDSSTGEIIVRLLSDLAKKANTTVVVVTHDLSVAKRAGKTFHLKDGKLSAA